MYNVLSNLTMIAPALSTLLRLWHPAAGRPGLSSCSGPLLSLSRPLRPINVTWPLYEAPAGPHVATAMRQMIVEPEQRVADFAKAGADIISIHAEQSATIHLDRTINQARAAVGCSFSAVMHVMRQAFSPGPQHSSRLMPGWVVHAALSGLHRESHLVPPGS